jgi:phage/plasmid-associated DNA primase
VSGSQIRKQSELLGDRLANEFREANAKVNGQNESGAEPGTTPEADLQQKYGPPAYKNTRDRINKLNEPFWAALYAREHAILFEPDEEKFFEYNSTAGIYEEKSTDCIHKELGERIFRAAVEWQQSYPGLREFRNNDSLRGIIQHLKGLVEDREAFSKKDPGLMHLTNCDLRITRNGFVNTKISPESKARWRSPFNYDEKADCPRFKNELLAPLCPDQQLVLQKIFALYLTGENPLHKIVILDGVAAGGKTTLALVFQEIFGPHRAGALRTSFLEDRFELGRIYDKSLLIGADVGPKFLQDSGAGALKRLTGGDYLEAELKTSNRRIDLYGRFNILITSNVRLKICLADDASAWLRRLIIIRYRQSITGSRILDFHKVLVNEEGAGILNWGLAGLELLRKDIEEFGDIKLTKEMEKIVKSLIEESDGLRLFLKNNIERAEYGDISVDEIVKAFTAHCQSLNWAMEPVEKIQRELETLMMELFSAGKSTDIDRLGKHARGYKKVKFIKTAKEAYEAYGEEY